MEFVNHEEALTVLQEQRVWQEPDGAERVYLRMADEVVVVDLHLACDASRAQPRPKAKVLKIDKEHLSHVVEQILHKLNLNDVLLIPVGKWRKIFDAVAFSLAHDEDWQAIDTAATVELNTRDPLVCGPADFNTLVALLQALFNDAEGPDQGLMMLTSGAPLLIEVVPDGAVRLSVGSAALADEILEVFDASST